MNASRKPGSVVLDARAERASDDERRPRFGADLHPLEAILGGNRWWRRQRFDLRGVDLRRATVERAYLKRASLAGVHVEGAKLSSAHLKGVIGLTHAHREGVIGLRQPALDWVGMVQQAP